MIRWLERRQVALYLAAIGLGLLIGCVGGEGAGGLRVLVTPVLALLIFLTFLGIPLRRIADAWRDARFVALVLGVNFVLVPVVVFGLSRVVAEDQAVLVGVLLVLLTPCVDYVIVFAGLAGGSRERLLAVTPLLMVLQLLLLPVYLLLFGAGASGGGEADGAGGGAAVPTDPRPFVEALLLLIVVPLLAAAVVHAAASRHASAHRVESQLQKGMVPAMAATLLLVVASQSALVLDELDRLALPALLFAAFAVVMTLVGTAIARLPGLTTGAGRALLFSGVTRNSLVVLPLALALPAGYELAPLVVVTQTLVELVAMVVLVRAAPMLIPERAPR